MGLAHSWYKNPYIKSHEIIFPIWYWNYPVIKAHGTAALLLCHVLNNRAIGWLKIVIINIQVMPLNFSWNSPQLLWGNLSWVGCRPGTSQRKCGTAVCIQNENLITKIFCNVFLAYYDIWMLHYRNELLCWMLEVWYDLHWAYALPVFTWRFWNLPDPVQF